MRATHSRALWIFSSLAFATPALAGHNEVMMGGSSRALRSSSADALTAAGMDGLSMAYARDLDLEVIPKLRLWGEAGYTTGEAKGMMFDMITTHVDMFGVTVGGRARYSVHRHVALSARVDLGSARTALSLTDGGGRKASATGWSSIAAAATALDLLPVELPRFVLGVRFELGYVAARGVELTPRRQTTGDTLMLPVSQSSFGKLDLSGPYFGFSLISQF